MEQCKAMTKRGVPCRNRASEGGHGYCKVHGASKMEQTKEKNTRKGKTWRQIFKEHKLGCGCLSVIAGAVLCILCLALFGWILELTGYRPSGSGVSTPTLGHCNSALLPGHLLLERGGAIHELTCTLTGAVQDQVITTGVGFNDGDVDSSSITISPDGRFLRYAINGGPTIVSQDLQTGAKHTYQVWGDVSFVCDSFGGCVSWSPSGTLVSYVTKGALIVENLRTGTHQVLVQEDSAVYGGATYFGAIDSGTWISDDILLFHQFYGGLPLEITLPGAPELAANTTTLASLSNGTFEPLVDTPGAYLEVRALSQDGTYVLLADTKDGSWKLAQASDFTSFDAMSQITCANCTLLGFVPHSDEVFGYQDDPSSLAYKGLVFVDPQSLAAQLGPTMLPAYVNDSTQQLEVIKWEGSPDHAIVVYEYQNTSENQDYYAVSSLQSGEVDWLIDASTTATEVSELLGWIP